MHGQTAAFTPDPRDPHLPECRQARQQQPDPHAVLRQPGGRPTAAEPAPRASQPPSGEKAPAHPKQEEDSQLNHPQPSAVLRVPPPPQDRGPQERCLAAPALTSSAPPNLAFVPLSGQAHTWLGPNSGSQQPRPHSAFVPRAHTSRQGLPSPRGRLGAHRVGRAPSIPPRALGGSASGERRRKAHTPGGSTRPESTVLHGGLARGAAPFHTGPRGPGGGPGTTRPVGEGEGERLGQEGRARGDGWGLWRSQRAGGPRGWAHLGARSAAGSRRSSTPGTQLVSSVQSACSPQLQPVEKREKSQVSRRLGR